MKRILLLSAVMASVGFCSAQTLVAHYNFDNFSTSDATTYGHNLTTIGVPPTAVPGKAGYPNTAYKFNGTGYFRSSASPALALTRWTLAAIVKFNSFPTTGCQVSYIVSSNGAQNTSTHYALETNDNQVDGSCAFSHPFLHQFFGMSAGSIPSPTGYPAGNYLGITHWYCLTATYDGDKVSTYIDGVWMYDRVWPSTPNYTGLPDPFLYIGTGFGGSGSQVDPNPPQYYLDADIDDIKVWNDVIPVSAPADSVCTSFASCWTGRIKWSSSYSTPYQYAFTANERQNVSGTCVNWTVKDPGGSTIGPFMTSGSNAFNASLNYGVTGTYEICAEVIDCITQRPCTNSVKTCFSMCVDGNTGAIVSTTGNGTQQTGTTKRGNAASRAKTTAGCSLLDVDYRGTSDSLSPDTFHAHPPPMPNERLRWSVDGGPWTIGPIGGSFRAEEFESSFTAGAHNICVEVIDAITLQPCGASICFDLCSDVNSMNKAPLSLDMLTGFDRGVGMPYPNPSDGQLTIPIRDLSGTVSATILAVDGRVVARTEQTVSEKTRELRISTKALAPGIYMLNVTAGGQTVTKRFTKN